MTYNQFNLIQENNSSLTLSPQSYQYAMFDTRRGLISLLHDEGIGYYAPFSGYHSTSTDELLGQYTIHLYDISQQYNRVKSLENSDHMYELLQDFVQYIYPKDGRYDSYIAQSRDRCANVIDIAIMDASRDEIEYLLIQLYAQSLCHTIEQKEYIFDQLRDEKTFQQYMSQLGDDVLSEDVVLDQTIQDMILELKYEHIRQKIAFYTIRDTVLLYEEYLELEHLMKESAEQDQFDIALLIQQYIDPYYS